MKEIRIDSNKSCTKVTPQKASTYFADVTLKTNDTIKVSMDCSSKDEFLNAKIETETKRATERENDLERQIIAGDSVTDVTVDGSSVVKDKVAEIELQPIMDSISSEAARAQSAESSLSSSIAAVQSDLSAEVSRATSREGELEKAISEAGKIDDVKVDGTSVVTDKVANIDLQPVRDSISAEEARAKAVEKTLTDGLSTEAAARENADTTLQSNLDKEITRASVKETELENSIYSGLAEEKKAREDADNLLQSNINAEASTRETNDNTLQTNIDEEASERKKADETLQSNLDSETARAKEAEEKLTTDLSTEATTRETNDNTLQTNIDTEVTRAKDAEKSIVDDLTAEASTRQTNDETLQSNIDAEAQTRYDADDDLGIQIAFQTQRAESAIGSLRTTMTDEISARETGDSDTLTASKAYTDQEKANYVLKSGDTMTGTLNVPTINSLNTSTAVSINTGTHAASYFQARKFRGQGDANTYNHAVDFGYTGHDRIDFYEYGGVFNFWANRGTSKLEGEGNRVASLQSGKILERGNTLTYPGKSGTFALTDDVTDGDAQTLTDAKVYVDQQISVIEIDGGEVSQ